MTLFSFLCPTPITCVNPSSEYPCSSCHGSFDEPFPEDLLEFGLEFKVLQAPVDRDEKLGKLQLPFLGHEVQEEIRFCIKRYAHILEKERLSIRETGRTA
jgi:hypothetical protein